MNIKKSIITLAFLTVGCHLSMAQTMLKRQLFVPKAGTLVEQLTLEEANQITHLKLNGKINAVDFRHLRDEFKNLKVLDLSTVSIATYAGKSGTYTGHFYIYRSNCVPAYAFCKLDTLGLPHGKASLQHIILSEKIKDIEEAAFKNCTSLRICQINKKKTPALMKEALSDSIHAIFVPLGCSDTYRENEKWKGFVVLENEPVSLELNIKSNSSIVNELTLRGIQPQNVNFLKVTGKLDEADFKLIRDYMPNLVYIDMENSLATAIPEYTFTQKKFLLHVTLPKNLRTIGQRAFSGCFRLNGTLILPKEVSAIEFGAFMDCDKLKEVVVTGNKLTTLGDQLFGNGKNKIKY